MPESGTPVELLRGLAVLAEPPSKEHEGIIAALGMQATPSSSEYSDVFMFQLYPYASVHLGQLTRWLQALIQLSAVPPCSPLW